jgi:two-component system phosphate regulon sensor histidine kinase PhoR
MYDIELIQSRVRHAAGVSILGVLILSLALTFLVAVFVSRPLDEMSTVARAMAKGDFSQKASIHMRDEIGDLARALNVMSEEIKDKIEKVNVERAKLDLILSSMFEGVIVTDADESIILMNPSLRKLFFIDSNPEGKKPIEVIRNSAIENMVERIIKGKQQLATEEIIINAPEEKILKVNGVPIVRNNKLKARYWCFTILPSLRVLRGSGRILWLTSLTNFALLYPV